MLDLPEHAVIVAGLQDWDYKGLQWRPVEEERLVALMRQQLGPKLSQNFSGLPHPPTFDEVRRDANGPGVAVRLFPNWLLADEMAQAAGAGAADAAPATNERGRLVECCYGLTAIAEISIFTSRPKRATFTVARAGGATLK
jgi:hypothetical protein